MVLGVGNPDRGDDGVGALVALRLVGRLPENVEVRRVSGDLMSLVGDWAGIDGLVCIDAAAASGTPGAVLRFDLACDELPRNMGATSSHAFGLPEAIALARTLGTAPGTIIVYAVAGGSFAAGAPVSRAVAEAVTDVAQRVTKDVLALQGSWEAVWASA